MFAGALQGGFSTSQLAGTSSFGMSGVNAHMLLASPVMAAHLSSQPPTSMPWERTRFYPLPKAHHLVQGFHRPGADSCTFSFSLGPQTAPLAQNLVCGQLLMPASALLEAAAAAMCTLDEELPRAALARVALPEQAPLPAQPASAAFTVTFSAAAEIAVRAEGNNKKPRAALLLQAQPFTAGHLARIPVITAAPRSALADITSRTVNAASDGAVGSASSIATGDAKIACCDGYLCMPRVSASALDLLTNGSSGPEQMLAPTVLRSAEAVTVVTHSARDSSIWTVARSGQRAKFGGAGVTGDNGEMTTYFEAVTFQVAKRAKQDAMEAAAGLLYEIEWQTASPLLVQDTSSSTPGAPVNATHPCCRIIA